jgi:hypothetical protein
MQNGSQARRVVISYDDYDASPDGVLPGLVKCGEVNLETNTIDVPTFNRIVKIQSGIVTMPEITLTYETKSDGTTLNYLRAWWENKDQKQMTYKKVDATGEIMEEVAWDNVEIRAFKEPEADLANPSFSQVEITVLPQDIYVMTAQTGEANGIGKVTIDQPGRRV